MLTAEVRESCAPGRLWSLWDMLTRYAREFIWLGEEIQQTRTGYYLAEEKPLEDGEKEEVKKSLGKLHKHCKEMELPISTTLLEQKIDDLPESYREFQLLMDVVYAEIRNKLFILFRRTGETILRLQSSCLSLSGTHFRPLIKSFATLANVFQWDSTQRPSSTP
jgi:hypothetical protein